MSQEHDTTKSDEVKVTDEIHPEPAPFEPAYQPETLPQITVPDLADDAQGLSAEALANVPTLTEFADEPEQEPRGGEAPADLPNAPDAAETASPEPMAEIQDTPAQADTWVEELQARMGKLNGDIQTLNARLDRLEERNKTKV
jgi:hypothetical protein